MPTNGNILGIEPAISGVAIAVDSGFVLDPAQFPSSWLLLDETKWRCSKMASEQGLAFTNGIRARHASGSILAREREWVDCRWRAKGNVEGVVVAGGSCTSSDIEPRADRVVIADLKEPGTGVRDDEVPAVPAWIRLLAECCAGADPSAPKAQNVTATKLILPVIRLHPMNPDFEEQKVERL
ncbi:hypothetical protein B0H19DRAFT_1079478 [Mycena capillaripes]|nr:hypothetical protein B0H19DRAFT_1079478 [Mycena capillaripes]